MLLKSFFRVILLASFLSVFLIENKAFAFNSNLIMSDAVFDNTYSMSEGDIQNFLNGFSNGCLKNYQAPYPNNYFSYGNNVPASRVIRRVSDLWGINPQVILATLEKEESLVSGSAGCPEWRYNSAMGMGCPDGGTCPAPAYAGFHQQVTKGAWQLKFNKERSLGNVGWDSPLDPDDDRYLTYPGPMTQGWRARVYGGASTYYDGYHNIDGQVVHLDSGATAAFYWYTPHFHGNQNLVLIFEQWFGSTLETNVPPYRWAYEGQWAYVDSNMTKPFTSRATVAPNETFYVRIKAKNTGYQTWNQANTKIGTSLPMDRHSGFQDASWQNFARPAILKESSVAPGNIGTFEFAMKAPNAVGTYREYFSLLIEGLTWMNDPGLFFSINVNEATTLADTNHKLTPGDILTGNNYLLSQDRNSTLNLERDGRLSIRTNYKIVWQSPSAGPNAKAVMQGDGNFVLYNQNWQPIWNTETDGNPGSRLLLQTDGNLVIYTPTNTPLWASYSIHTPNLLSYINTNLSIGIMRQGQRISTINRNVVLVLQGDGNLVLYKNNYPVWATGTDNKDGQYLAMQPDGNLVLYNSNWQAIWFSQTSGYGNLRLVVQPDGNLVLYDLSGRPYWHTGTYN